MNPTVRLIAHGLLGAAFGLLTTVIFCLIYLFQTFDMPVSESLRFKSALFLTAIILLVIFLIWFRKDIGERMKQYYDLKEGEDDSPE
jgi:integral membrane sensor domain MASE1